MKSETNKEKLKCKKLCILCQTGFKRGLQLAIDSALYSFVLICTEIYRFFIYLNSHSEGDTFNSHLILCHVFRIRLYIYQQIIYWIRTNKIESVVLLQIVYDHLVRLKLKLGNHENDNDLNYSPE